MSHQNQEVIQIDDSNSRSQEHPQEHAAQSNNISLNFNPQVFPKLYSLLSKKQDIKEKAQPTLPVKQTPKPEAIPMVIDEPEAIEVSTIIKILPPPIQPKASQTIKQGEINQNKENNTTEVTQMNRDILIVQENFEPLLEQPLVQQPQQNPPEVLECKQNILNQEKEGQIMVCPVEPMVIQQAPNIIIQRQDNLQCQQPQFSQSIIANPQPTQHIEVQIDNNKIEHNISDPQTNQDLIENNREIVIPSIIQDHHMDIEEAIKPEDQQINESIPDVNQNVLPNLNEGLGTHEIVTIPEQNTSKLDFNVDQIAQMKKKIGQQIPELSISIQYMTNQEVLDTYNNLQQQHFNIIKEPIIQNKPQTLPLQRYENQQSITLQLINQSTNQIQTFSQQKQKLSIHMNESYPNLEAMASLGQEQLRNNLTINYPQAKDSLLQMNYQELRSLLSEVLVQIKKKQTNNNQQAKQIPANQADQTEKTEQDHSNKPAITQADMIKSLTQLNPNLKLLFEKMDQSYIKDLYNQSIELKLGSSLQNNNKIMKKIILDDKISHSFILQLCSEKFPHLQDQVRQLTEQEIKKIYEDVSNHEGPWNIPLLLQKYKISPAQQQNTNKALQLQQNVRMEKQNIENEIPVLSLARSHSMMENPETINMKPVQNQLQLKAGQHNILKIKKPNVEENIQQIDVSSKKTQQGKVQKKKGLKNMAPGELRAKLIAKLPQLKDNIMRLDDKEIQKIFRESMQNSKAQSANQSKKLRYDQEFKPVIIIPDKKYRPELEKQLQQKNKEMIIDQEKTKVYQIKDSSKKKKMRTMVVIHTEQIDESAQNGYKMKRTDNGIEKKGVGYDSASRLQISEIIKLLTEAIERRDE